MTAIFSLDQNLKKSIVNYEKYFLMLLLLVSHAQIKKKQLDLMPWPNNINQ
jgi:hypothetical protein